MRSEHSATALLAVQLTKLAVANFGGKDSDAQIEDFMPIKAILAPDDPVLLMANYLGIDTFKIFDKVSKSKDVNPYMVKAFRNEELIVKAMDYLRRYERNT